MAKVYTVNSKIEDEISNVFADCGLERYATLKVFAVDKQKVLVRVSKASATVEHLCETSETVLCYVNEKLYNALNDDAKKMLILNAFSNVYYDGEKDRLHVEQPDMMVSSGCYEKYGDELTKAVYAQSVTLESLAEAEKEEKERAKAAKKEAKKNGK